jgi:hypothetical protein
VTFVLTTARLAPSRSITESMLSSVDWKRRGYAVGMLASISKQRQLDSATVARMRRVGSEDSHPVNRAIASFAVEQLR